MAENAKTPEQKELETLKAKLAELEQANADQEEIIQEQLDQLENAKATAGKALPVVTFEKKQYQLTAPKAKIAGKVYSAEEIATDKELVGKLIGINSGLLQLISK